LTALLTAEKTLAFVAKVSRKGEQIELRGRIRITTESFEEMAKVTRVHTVQVATGRRCGRRKREERERARFESERESDQRRRTNGQMDEGGMMRKDRVNCDPIKSDVNAKQEDSKGERGQCERSD
jgi:hypothetical protein